MVAPLAVQAAPKQAAASSTAAAPKRPAAPRKPRGPSAFVPGSGTAIDYVGDDFEDAGWELRSQASQELAGSRTSSSAGRWAQSTNDRWHEGPERGQPDHLEVVPTPAGGIEGSVQALSLRTLHSGIPGLNTRDVQQDDLIANCISRLRGGIPVSERPSCTVRVYLPPADQWENRSGPHFGYRASCFDDDHGTTTTGLFSISRESEVEPYWPGMWIHFRSAGSRGAPRRTRRTSRFAANRMGHDFRVQEISIDEFGWWTFGMSFSPDGMVHYYASPGVDELTAADYLTSQFPYGYPGPAVPHVFLRRVQSQRRPDMVDAVRDRRPEAVRGRRTARGVDRRPEGAARNPHGGAKCSSARQSELRRWKARKTSGGNSGKRR